MRDRQPPPKPDLQQAMEREIDRAEAGPQRRRTQNPLREFLRAHPVFTTVLILGLALGGYIVADRAIETDEEMIQDTIEAVAEGLEDEDEAKVMEQFSQEFQEEGGVDYDFLESRLPVLLERANWGISSPELTGIQVVDDSASVSEVYVVVAADGRAVQSRWRLRLQRETDENGEPRWRITSAYPLSVQDRSVDGITGLIRRYRR